MKNNYVHNETFIFDLSKVFKTMNIRFKDNYVIFPIPHYFNDSETPIICFNITNQLGLLYLTLIKLKLI